jgi:aspartyl-tRNA(Asn)/glutamyl-tRNA(Gln) amidotransferase subunit B
MSQYTASIGMEIHAELLTESKMFCRCPVDFGGEPNTRVCPVCLSMPGSLPVPNRKAIEYVLRTALALNCTIAMRSIFHRKNYFYPDLPKGYQISQYGDTNPLGYDGYLEIPNPNGGLKKIHIRRVHLEEDAGKLLHLSQDGSGVDYNRAGVPLMETVTEFPPDITSAEEAKEYLVQFRLLLLYLGVCDGKMEEGSLRCEPNVSVRPEGANQFGTKSEIKNLNSFRSVQLGVQYEIRRQIDLIEKGESVVQETRGWNEQREESFTMRVKEEENDYRYFPDPDLIPMVFDEAYIEELRRGLPELPMAKLKRYQEQLGLSQEDAIRLISDPQWAYFFEEAVDQGGDPKLICNWMNSDFAKYLNGAGLDVRQSKVTPQHLVQLVQLIRNGTLSGKLGKQVFEESFQTGKLPQTVVDERGLAQISDVEQIKSAVAKVLAAHPDIVAKYLSGQVGVVGFLIGQVMKETQGRANPAIVKEILEGALS